MRNTEKLWKIFISTFYLSAFTFGGGYVIITLMKKKFVNELKWIDEKEMLDLVAIAQSSPGVIAINGAIVIGYKLAGVVGIIVSVLGTVLPPFFFISVISLFYEAFQSNIYITWILEGMQAGVVAVIASAVYEMASGIIKEKNPLWMTIMLLAFVLNYGFGISVIYIVLGCGLLGLIQALFGRKVA